MSRSAAATARQHAARRSVVAPAPPRRVSGPLNPQPQRSPRARVDTRTLDLTRENPHRRSLATRPPLRIAAEGGLTLASAVAGVALDVSSSKLMDRLVRSRAWVVIVAFGLIGIVAMQVSLLKLNAGIGRAVETIGSLERSNASLRGEVSRLSSGDRIQSLAGARGFVMPAPADVTFLRAGNLRSDAFRASKRMRSPDPAVAGPAGAAILPQTITGITGPTGAATQAAPGTEAPMPGTEAPVPGTETAAPGTTPAATAPVTPAPATTPPATTAPGAIAPGATAPAPVAPAPAQAPVATGAAAAPTSGGVTPQTTPPVP